MHCSDLFLPILQWLIQFPFCWMNYQKSKFLLISYILTVRGCWGHPMLLFLKKKECISKIYYFRIPKLLSNKILLTYFNLSEPIHKIQFNVRYPVQCMHISRLTGVVGKVWPMLMSIKQWFFSAILTSKQYWPQLVHFTVLLHTYVESQKERNFCSSYS